MSVHLSILTLLLLSQTGLATGPIDPKACVTRKMDDAKYLARAVEVRADPANHDEISIRYQPGPLSTARVDFASLRSVPEETLELNFEEWVPPGDRFQGAPKFGSTHVNGILVTGGRSPTEVILGEAPDEYVMTGSFGNRLILSIGEGLDRMVPALAKTGHLVRALDPLYALGASGIEKDLNQSSYQEAVEYIRANRDWLVAGSVLHIPYANNSIDLIFCSRLFNNLDDASVKPALMEILRVLKPGGEVRIGMVSQVFEEKIKNIPGVERKKGQLYVIRKPRL